MDLSPLRQMAHTEARTQTHRIPNHNHIRAIDYIQHHCSTHAYPDWWISKTRRRIKKCHNLDTFITKREFSTSSSTLPLDEEIVTLGTGKKAFGLLWWAWSVTHLTLDDDGHKVGSGDYFATEQNAKPASQPAWGSPSFTFPSLPFLSALPSLYRL